MPTPLTWRSEFGDSYACDVALGGAINGLVDTSWSNDSAPSFRHPDDPQQFLTLWVQHPDPEWREWCPEFRYVITALDYDGECSTTNIPDQALHRLALLVHGDTCPTHHVIHGV